MPKWRKNVWFSFLVLGLKYNDASRKNILNDGACCKLVQNTFTIALNIHWQLIGTYVTWQVDLGDLNGCSGMIFYTDPADYVVDGISAVYPDSCWLPGTGLNEERSRKVTVDLGIH
jgi:hypothetical protein